VPLERVTAHEASPTLVAAELASWCAEAEACQATSAALADLLGDAVDARLGLGLVRARDVALKVVLAAEGTAAVGLTGWIGAGKGLGAIRVGVMRRDVRGEVVGTRKGPIALGALEALAARALLALAVLALLALCLLVVLVLLLLLLQVAQFLRDAILLLARLALGCEGRTVRVEVLERLLVGQPMHRIGELAVRLLVAWQRVALGIEAHGGLSHRLEVVPREVHELIGLFGVVVDGRALAGLGRCTRGWLDRRRWSRCAGERCRRCRRCG
jgi:hypothetical protein